MSVLKLAGGLIKPEVDSSFFLWLCDLLAYPLFSNQILLSQITTETVASSDIKTMIGAAFGVLHISLQKAKVKDVFCLFVFYLFHK